MIISNMKEKNINFFCFLGAQLKSHLNVVDLKLKPLTSVMSKTLFQLQAKDPGEIFLEPVDTNEVG